MFGIDLSGQPEIVVQVAGYIEAGWELAASWLLSPAAWSQFGLLVVAYFAALMVTRKLRPLLVRVLDPGDSTPMCSPESVKALCDHCSTAVL